MYKTSVCETHCTTRAWRRCALDWLVITDHILSHTSSSLITNTLKKVRDERAKSGLRVSTVDCILFQNRGEYKQEDWNTMGMQHAYEVYDLGLAMR